MKQTLKIIIFLMVVPAMMLAKYHMVRNEREFKELLKKYEYCIVCFVPSRLAPEAYIYGDEQELLSQNFKNLQNRMQAAAKSDDFKDFLHNDVGFLLVDTGLNETSSLVDKYGITIFGECLLFDGEFAVKKRFRKAPESASDLINMLQMLFGPEIIELIIKRKKEKNARTRHEVPIYSESGSYDNNWMPSATYPYSRWGSGPYGVSYDMTGLENL